MRISELADATGFPVATIKYYLREGLLPVADKRSERLAEYDERHVRRLRLIKLLREVGNIPIEGLRRLVEASERTDVPIDDLFAAAAVALSPAPPPPGSCARSPARWPTSSIADAGWTHVRPDSPDRENLAATLELIASYDTHRATRARSSRTSASQTRSPAMRSGTSTTPRTGSACLKKWWSVKSCSGRSSRRSGDWPKSTTAFSGSATTTEPELAVSEVASNQPRRMLHACTANVRIQT